MPDAVKTLLTIVLCPALMGGAFALIDLALGGVVGTFTAFLIGGSIGLVYGILSGAVQSYDLGALGGWGMLLLDMTWSLPNTVFGVLTGSWIYLLFGTPSQSLSSGLGWVSYAPRGGSGFGHGVLQTVGTINIGGAGQHERMHLLQARVFGPLYLPLFAVNYVFTGLIQLLFTCTIGLLLKAIGSRQTAWLEPPAKSAVQGPFGWIYYATFFELWAYASGNP
jgi:hypothetical protein